MKCAVCGRNIIESMEDVYEVHFKDCFFIDFYTSLWDHAGTVDFILD